MKKLIKIMMAAMLVLVLASCSAKEKEPENKTPDYYGTYKVVKLESMDGSISQDALDLTLDQMLSKNQLFYLEIGDTSYIYNPKDGELVPNEMTADFDNMLFKNAGNPNDPGMEFKYEEGQIIIEEPNSQIRFILGKQ